MIFPVSSSHPPFFGVVGKIGNSSSLFGECNDKSLMCHRSRRKHNPNSSTLGPWILRVCHCSIRKARQGRSQASLLSPPWLPLPEGQGRGTQGLFGEKLHLWENQVCPRFLEKNFPLAEPTTDRNACPLLTKTNC